jgi:hypothetical protein
VTYFHDDWLIDMTEGPEWLQYVGSASFEVFKWSIGRERLINYTTII